MNWKAASRKLLSLFPTKKIELADGAVYIPEAPVGLSEIVLNYVEDEYEEEFLGDDVQLEYQIEHYGKKFGWTYRRGFAFVWYSGGPMCGDSYLNLLDLGGDRAFVCVRPCEEPLSAIAAITPKQSPSVLSAFFRNLVAGNGYEYGYEIFGTLPFQMTNLVEDLIPAEVVKECCFDWMEKFNTEEYMTWSDLVFQIGLSHRDTPEYTLQLLRQFGGHESLEEYLLERAVGEWSLKEKQAILDSYFSRAYTNEDVR